ncbi:MAG: type II and III secretion system protein family protein [Hyphomonas sp.]|jgi:pilus assembly protein CpaC|uniref:type II and III secretion system protein family protein n=1 Tax=Hyphomonas sp. TaxID=87 RepID=UPI001825A655|nr:type II and III secretion system protein family protein [Hyphomonas sp.]MBA3069984.1 type II and III secretion system protein family protein [Hyphomonas sp.]MBU4060440.1 type II and III secretion system protein family protein [Alphaproteobacteria bacterium]MBU4163108.1 type II and III secretion system protein family protein [Alphaproteobacteria bacterium]
MRLARIISAALLVCACLVPPASAWMQRSADDGAQRLEVRRGQSAVVETDLAFATIVVADPEIAEAMATSNRSFFLRGKTPGSTTVLVYNSAGAIAELIEIDVKLGLEELRQDIRRLLPGEPIEVYPVHDGVFLDGRVTTAGAAEMALQVAERYVPGGVANGLTVGQSQQVLLEVRFLEASRSAVREIGFGNTVDANDFQSSTDSGTISGLAEKTVALFTNLGGENIDVRIRALEEKGVIRTLAEPNLVALSGDTASFLAGGEFPIPVASKDNEITIEFKKFGVSLDFTPTVLGDGLVNLRVRPEVSALDKANGIRAANIEIPGISVRRADTTVELHDGQAFAVAGLLQNNYSNDVRQTPWLGSVPILGALFSSKRYQRNESELVIIVTPRLVQPQPHPDQLASPLDAFAEPTEAELLLFGRTTGAPSENAGY